MKTQFTKTLLIAAIICSPISNSSNACTGITLRSKDGAVVFGRTLEWGSFDLNSRLVVVPQGYEYKSELPEGKHGLTWKTKYGAVGLDAVGKDLILDGMNEKGLSVNLFYHPGYAEYPAFDPSKSATTMGSLDFPQYLLTTCSSIEEIRAALAKVHIVGVVEPSIGIESPIHVIATEPSGKAIVIEFTGDNVKIHEAFGNDIPRMVDTQSAADAVQLAFSYAEPGDVVVLSDFAPLRDHSSSGCSSIFVSRPHLSQWP